MLAALLGNTLQLVLRAQRGDRGGVRARLLLRRRGGAAAASAGGACSASKISPSAARAFASARSSVRSKRLTWRSPAAAAPPSPRARAAAPRAPRACASTIWSKTAASSSARKSDGSSSGSITRRYSKRSAAVLHCRRHARGNSCPVLGGANRAAAAGAAAATAAAAAAAAADAGGAAAAVASYAGITKKSNGLLIDASSALFGLTGLRCAPATSFSKVVVLDVLLDGAHLGVVHLLLPLVVLERAEHRGLERVHGACGCLCGVRKRACAARSALAARGQRATADEPRDLGPDSGLSLGPEKFMAPEFLSCHARWLMPARSGSETARALGCCRRRRSTQSASASSSSATPPPTPKPMASGRARHAAVRAA